MNNKPYYVKIHNMSESGINVEAHDAARLILSHNAFVLYDVLEFTAHDSIAVVRRHFSKTTEEEFDAAIKELLYHGYLIQEPVVISEYEVELEGYHFFENTFDYQFREGLIDPFKLN